MILELVFPATGTLLPTDHAYPLYAALTGAVPAFHDPAGRVRFAPVTGDPAAAGTLRLTGRSVLRVRLPDDAIRVVLPLAGRRLDIAGHPVRLGVPAVRTLLPAPAVAARLVTFKNADDPAEFRATAVAKLAALGVTGEPHLPAHAAGPRAGKPRRRVVRIKGKAITGYALLIAGLTAADSVVLQESGLGGRTRIGCGFFMPVREGE